MSRSGSAKVLSRVALILRASSEPTFRVDHTVIFTPDQNWLISPYRETTPPRAAWSRLKVDDLIPGKGSSARVSTIRSAIVVRQ